MTLLVSLKNFVPKQSANSELEWNKAWTTGMTRMTGTTGVTKMTGITGMTRMTGMTGMTGKTGILRLG